jgi:hypothetical protein
MAWSISRGLYNPINRARMKAPKPAVAPVGTGHHTVATRTMMAHGFGHTGLGGRRKKKAHPGATRRRHRTATQTARHPKRSRKVRKTRAHMVKGSRAARRHMATLRAMKKAA